MNARTSGNDGSYTLTVSFALGTNPDINTVNVNNRVQTALSQLPPEVQQQGLVVQKKSGRVIGGNGRVAAMRAWFDKQSAAPWH